MIVWLRVVVSGLILAVVAQGARAQVYPVRPITIVAPFAAGGAANVVSRLLAERLTGILRQPVKVENRAGGGGTLATQQVSKAVPDGYTLLYVTNSTLVYSPIFLRTPGYDPLRSIAPISLIGWMPGIAVVNPKVPARDLRELMSLIKAAPGKYRYAHSGIGGLSYLAGELFKSETGLDVQDVSAKGLAAARQRVMDGDADMMFDLVVGLFPKVREGQLRALCVMGPNRVGELPDVPTVAEAGMPEFTAYNWGGLAAPFGTAPETVQVLNKGVLEVLSEIETTATFRNYGLYAEGSTPEELRKIIQAELTKWARALPLSATAPR